MRKRHYGLNWLSGYYGDGNGRPRMRFRTRGRVFPIRDLPIPVSASAQWLST